MKNEFYSNRRLAAILILATCLLQSVITERVLARKLPRVDLLSVSAAEPNKFALLVGISGYDRKNKKKDFDWWDLNAPNDVELLANVLIERFKFKPENIKILCDKPIKVGDKMIPASTPTHEAIANAFKQHIIDKTNKGDVVYFHFSGHGQQVPDDNGDESDGYDETLIPSDYVSQKDGSKNVRDDEISSWLKSLDEKEPSSVTVTFDSCFSGTAVRGSEGLKRGGPWKGDPIDPAKAGRSDETIGDFVTRGGPRKGGNAQNYVFLSAAGSRQTASETKVGEKEYGLFSYSLATAMQSVNATTTNRDLYEQIFNVMTRGQRGQTPQMEGDQLDKFVMTIGGVAPDRYYRITNEHGQLMLAAGKLQGMTEGSTLALYGEGAKKHEDGKEIAVAQLKNVGASTSELSLKNKLDEKTMQALTRGFEIEHKYEDTLRVTVENGIDTKYDMKSIFRSDALAVRVAPDQEWDIKVRRPDTAGLDAKEKFIDPKFKGLIVQRRDGSIIATIPDGDDLDKSLTATLKREATWMLVKSFDKTIDPTLDVVTLKAIPISVTQNDRGQLMPDKEKDVDGVTQDGVLRFKACERNEAGRCKPNTGDWVRFELLNSGPDPLYVTILDLQNDGKINVIYPENNIKENKVYPGTPLKVRNYLHLTPPYGLETIVVIVTYEETDFSPLADDTMTKRGGTRGSENAQNSPIGRMLKNASSGKRGETGAAPASWATVTKNFLITPQ